MSQYVNEQFGIIEQETNPSDGQIQGPPISGLMNYDTNIQPTVSDTEYTGDERLLLSGSSQSANGPEVGFHCGFERDHGAQVGNGLPAHQAREAACVDSRVSCHASQAVTCLEHRDIAGLDKPRNSDGVFRGIKTERALGPVSPINEPGIGRDVTTGHDTHSGLYPGCSSGVEGVVMITEVLHMCIASLKYAHYEASRDTERSASAYPVRGTS